MIQKPLFVAKILQKLAISDLAIDWSENNYMKLNTDKCHLLMSKYERFEAQMSKDKIWKDNEVKLLRIATNKFEI